MAKKKVKVLSHAEELQVARMQIASLSGILARVCGALSLSGDTEVERAEVLNAYLYRVEAKKLEQHEQRASASDPF